MSIFSKKESYSNIILLLLLALSFSKSIPNIILGVVLLFYAVLFYQKEIVFPKKHYFFPFGLLFLYLLIKAVFESSIGNEVNVFSRFLIVIILPIVFIPVPKNKIIWGFIASVFIAVSIALIHTFIYYLHNKTLPFSTGEDVNRILIIERPYMGFICLIALILCLFMAKEYPKFKKALFALGLFFGIFIFFIASRLSLITLIGVGIIYILFYSGLSAVKKAIIITVCFMAVFTALLSYKNLSNRFFVADSFQTMKDYEPRVVIWSCASEIIRSSDFNLIFGSKSFNWMQEQYVQCYADSITNESKKAWFLAIKYNSHNQFIDFFLIGGFLGLGLFLFFLFSIMKNAIGNFYFFSIVVSLTLFFLMENVLHRQFGCYLTAIIFSITTKYRDEKN
jgi:O-antigen ligase